MSVPILGAIAPAILTALGGERKPAEYTSGLSSQDQSFQNWIRQQIQQKSTQGSSPNTKNAQSLLYNRFFGGMPQNMTGQQPQQQQQTQQNIAGILPELFGSNQFSRQPYPRQ